MNRRSFVRNGLLAGAAWSTIHPSEGSKKIFPMSPDKPFHLDYAIHEGMFNHHAGNDFIDQIRFAYERGFRSIEDNGLAGRSIELQEKIGRTLASLGMRMGVFVLPKGGNAANTLAAGKQEHLDIFLKGCRTSVEVAGRVNAKWVTLVPGDFDRSLPYGIQMANVVDALRRGVEILEPHGIVMVLEALSDTPDLFLRTTEQAFEICRSVNSPSCKVLYDAYHMQKNEGNLIRNIELAWQEIAYFQVGDNPGRKEPGTGEINYKNLFRYIHQKGYTGIIGMEHGLSLPGKEGELALIKAYRNCDDFL